MQERRFTSIYNALHGSAHEGGGVAGASPDLEDALIAVKAEFLDRERDDVRLRDGLPAADRQRRVFVGAMPHSRGHEGMPRCEIERAEHGEVADALLAQRLDQSAARAAHRAVYGSRHQLPAESSML